MTYKDNRPSKVFKSKEGYDKYASVYDKRINFLNQFEGEVILKMLKGIEGKKVLDIGCGTGRLVGKLLERKALVTGVDVSGEMLKIASKKFKSTEFIEADAEKMPFPDESFDMMIASFLIVHLKDLDKFFDEAYRILRPGGSFIVTNINQRKAPKLKTSKNEDVVITSFYHIPEHVISLLEKSWFKIEDEEFVYDNAVWINQIVKAVKG